MILCVIDEVNGANISDNVFIGGAGVPTAIYITGAPAVDVTVGINSYLNITTTVNSVSATTSIKGMPVVTVAQLPTCADGSVLYCSDGTIANPVAGGGTGCIAKRLNGVWVGN